MGSPDRGDASVRIESVAIREWPGPESFRIENVVGMRSRRQHRCDAAGPAEAASRVLAEQL